MVLAKAVSQIDTVFGQHDVIKDVVNKSEFVTKIILFLQHNFNDRKQEKLILMLMHLLGNLIEAYNDDDDEKVQIQV
jgi:hypothetical protein